MNIRHVHWWTGHAGRVGVVARDNMRSFTDVEIYRGNGYRRVVRISDKVLSNFRFTIANGIRKGLSVAELTAFLQAACGDLKGSFIQLKCSTEIAQAGFNTFVHAMENVSRTMHQRAMQQHTNPTATQETPAMKPRMYR